MDLPQHCLTAAMVSYLFGPCLERLCPTPTSRTDLSLSHPDHPVYLGLTTIILDLVDPF
jgi:hypothetical protein